MLLEGSQRGGAERDVLHLARGLRARGHDVLVAAAGDAMWELAEQQGQPFERLPGLRGLVALCRRRRIDVINAHSVRTTALAGLAVRTRSVRARLVTVIHNIHDRRNDWLAYPILRLLPDALVFVSHYERSRLAARWGRALGEVVHTGIDVVDPEQVDAAGLRAHLGVPEAARAIGFVGRVSPEKGIDDAVRVLARLPEDVVLCIVGSGPDEARLRHLVADEGLEARVFFAGHSDRVPAHLKGFACLVLPSRRESLPVVLREAGMMELPVVAADVGGVREVVVPGETGLVYPSGDLAALAEALRALLESPERARELGRAARRRVLAQFGVEAWLDRMEAMLAG